MKKKVLLSSVVLALLVALVMPIAALADGPGNSEPGGDRYEEISSHPNENAQCGTGAGSGAFGWLGKGINPGQDSWDGGNGEKPGTTSQTGINNSAVCGNRQN